MTAGDAISGVALLGILVLIGWAIFQLGISRRRLSALGWLRATALLAALWLVVDLQHDNTWNVALDAVVLTGSLVILFYERQLEAVRAEVRRLTGDRD